MISYLEKFREVGFDIDLFNRVLFGEIQLIGKFNVLGCGNFQVWFRKMVGIGDFGSNGYFKIWDIILENLEGGFQKIKQAEV